MNPEGLLKTSNSWLIMNITTVIDKTVNAIHSGEQFKKQVSQRLMPLKSREFSQTGELPEEKLSFPVGKWVPDCLVGGVDSGFVAKRLANVDLVLIRAVGVVFGYRAGKVEFTKYWPGYFRFPEPHLSAGALEQDEAEQSKSLMRLRKEVEAAKSIIERHSPKYLFIDGSIVPQYQDKPRKESALAGHYSDIITEFESLYAFAEKNNCTLIATVEDSRGKRFVEMLSGISKDEKLGWMLDSSLLEYFLNVGERTCAFTYTKDVDKHPVLQDFNSKWSKSIYGLYIKPSVLDRPLRCEFICHGELTEKAGEVASVALALSSLHREYAYPSVLIEADLRAKLTAQEIEIVYNKIMDKLGAATRLKMRRENRPF